MKKKIYLLVVVAMLVVCMASMIACSNTTDATKKGNTTLDISNGIGSTSQELGMQVNSKTAFEVYSSESVTAQQLVGLISVKEVKTGEKAQVTIISKDGSDHYFKVVAPSQGYKEDTYYRIALDSSLQFVAWPEFSEIKFYVPKAGDAIANYKEDVVIVPADFVEVISYDEAKDITTLDYAYAETGKKINVGDVLIADNEGKQTAYYITSREEIDGFYHCTASKPQADDVYEALIIENQSQLNSSVKDDVVSTLDEEAIAKELSEIAEASFGVGNAKFDINAALNDGDVVLEIKMTLPDVIELSETTKADLVLAFKIYSDIEVTTNIAVGSNVKDILSEAKKGVTVAADFNNTLTFEAKVMDDVNLSEATNLDEVIAKIYAMVEGVDESDVEIKVFNWVIPIAEGVADVKLDVKTTMDFAFHGEIGVVSTSTMTFRTTAIYDLESEDKTFDVATDNFSYSLDSIALEAQTNIEIKVGLKADIAFDLLGGVLSIGLRATVGNYNDLYLDIETSNLLEIENGFDVAYGFYFAGGIYYDVGLTYKVASIANGFQSFLGGEQRKQLYSAGSQIMVNSITTESIVVGPSAMDLELKGIQRNIVTNVVDSELTLIDAKTVTLYDANGYVQLADGKISLTEAGAKQALKSYKVTVSVNGVEKDILVSSVAGQEANAGRQIEVAIGEGRGVVTAKYVGGEGLNVTYAGETATIAPEDAIAGSTIIIYVDGVAEKIVYVK